MSFTHIDCLYAYEISKLHIGKIFLIKQGEGQAGTPLNVILPVLSPTLPWTCVQIFGNTLTILRKTAHPDNWMCGNFYMTLSCSTRIQISQPYKAEGQTKYCNP